MAQLDVDFPRKLLIRRHGKSSALVALIEGWDITSTAPACRETA
jgi:hypothetical protein